MSDPSNSQKSLSGWTMVDSKGEVMSASDDNRSVSSDTSAEMVNLLEEDTTVGELVTALSQSGQNEEQQHPDSPSVLIMSGVGEQDKASGGENISSVAYNAYKQLSEVSQNPEETGGNDYDNSRQKTENTIDCVSVHDPSGGSLVEREEGLGACCEMLESRGYALDQTSEGQECEDVDEMDAIHHNFVSSAPLPINGAAPTPYLNIDCEEDANSPQSDNSDSDSDFVQIDDDNLEEFEEEILRSRHNTPSRSPSIAEGFHFLGPQVRAAREEEEEVEDNNRLSDDDMELNSEDFNEDTESSTEDVDDRIESDQSDVGVVNTLTDVGDLSVFADIGDLPLIVGNVARNYQHRPNNRLSTILNVILVVVTILTMGISIGLIMATDLEIDEWQSAYQVQVKKAASLEWTLGDMNRALQESKDKINAYETVIRSISKTNDNDFESSYTTLERSIQSKEKKPDVRELEMSLHREKERAGHWQNLYLLERRQREWERENEDLEDRRERARWEKEDEEEDRKEREKWEQEEAENDRRERLLWEKEEEEEDRRDREKWQKEEEEEDKREREKWEKEREELNSLECLKKLMNTNLTVLKNHVTNLNMSSFDDFVNISALRSGIAELKQSVLASVQQIWVEAEKALHKVGDDVKDGKKTYLDTSLMADYLKQALSVLQSQFDNVVNENVDDLFEFAQKETTTEENDDDNAKKQKRSSSEEDSKESRGKGKQSGLWNKTIGKMFKKTSKSLRKFVRTMTTSWMQVKGMWGKKTSKSSHRGNKDETEIFDSLPSWLTGKACRSVWNYVVRHENIIEDIGSPCLWDMRGGWGTLVMKEPCLAENRYSLACNVDPNAIQRLEGDFKNVLKMEEQISYVHMSAGKKYLYQYEKFWRTWGSSELLLKSDKDWVSCQLKFWSDASSEANAERFLDVRSPCSRLINLSNVVKEIEDRQLKYRMEAVDSDDDDEATVEVEAEDVDDGKLQMERSPRHESHDDEEGDAGVIDEIVDDVKDDYEEVNDGVTEEIVDDVKDDHDSTPYPNESSEKPSENTQKRNSSHFGGDMNEDDYYEKMAWYLKRAQHRLEMRRAQEKDMWFFYMSHHRGEMRKEHNLEKKSGQWLFRQGEDRAAQRKKEHESDWLFERARHRREESDRLWGHRGIVESMKKRRKMKDLSESDWLLHKDGSRHGADGNAKKQKPSHGKRRLHTKMPHTSHSHQKPKQHEKRKQLRQPYGKRAPNK